ncbi:hypothetical protein SLS60_006048 [Paraconiothyrium brasiliense]|uniref:MFS transporter n=1 Tax=Paraconiothyrium brasiliense TaxID=300254 RepID=A0ABR3RDW5_9PLEO
MSSRLNEDEPLLGHRHAEATKSDRGTLSHVKSLFWGPASIERSVVMKLDLTILPYFSLIWFLFGVNRASYSHAYISGMKEDLDFQGNQFNMMITIYMVFYAIFQIPSTSLLTLARPKYVFVAANVAWSVLTLLTFRMQHVHQLFILSGFEGWIVIPNLPVHKSAWYLSDEEKDVAVTRLGKTKQTSWDLSVFRRVLLSWQFWLLPMIFMLYSLCIQACGNNVMPLWMASRGYTTIQQNTYPTAIYLFAILGTITYSLISDHLQSRWQPSLAIGMTFIIGSAILVADPAADAWHFFAFYLLGTTYAPQAVWYSWMADVTAHDVQLRAITTGWMNSFDFAFVTWWPLVFYPVTDAPHYEKGYIASLVTGALVVPFVGLIAYLETRDRRNGKIGLNFDAQGEENDDMVNEDVDSGLVSVPQIS